MDEQDSKRKREDPRNEDSHKRDSAPVYKIFYTIDKAWEYSLAKGRLPLFSLDKPNPKNPGAKVFIVAGYNRFYDIYAKMKPETRCFYETVLPDIPCHLHVDAEYNRERNPIADQTWVDKTLRSEIIQFMMELEFIEKPEDVKVISLDSSNEVKFSKHYLFVIKDGTRFKNNYHCGAFIRRLRKRMLDKYGQDRTKNPLFAWAIRKKASENNDPDKALEFVADVCVFTFRRQFRLVGSTKRKGPYRPLLPEGVDKSKFVLTRDRFFETLIQRIDDYSKLKIVECKEENGEEPISTSRKREKKDVERSRLVFPSQGVISRKESFTSDPPPPFTDKLGLCLINAWMKKTGHGGGDLHFLYYNSEYQTLRFDSTTKYCLTKGDYHQGNHVWFRVYLRSRTFAQGCYSEKASCTSSNGEKILSERIDLELTPELEEKVAKHVGNRRHKAFSPLVLGFMSLMDYHNYIGEEDKILSL